MSLLTAATSPDTAAWYSAASFCADHRTNDTVQKVNSACIVDVGGALKLKIEGESGVCKGA